MTDYKDYTWHKFWLTSSRGTNITEYKFFPPGVDPGFALEDWAHLKGGELVSIEYGRKKVDMPPQNVLCNMIKRRTDRLRREMDLLKAYERMLYETYGAPDPHETHDHTD